MASLVPHLQARGNAAGEGGRRNIITGFVDGEEDGDIDIMILVIVLTVIEATTPVATTRIGRDMIGEEAIADQASHLVQAVQVRAARVARAAGNAVSFYILHHYYLSV